MSIDWRRYFDHIYCIHYLGNKARRQGIRLELERVGILDSGIFSFAYTSPDPWERFIVANCPKVANDETGNRGFVNLGQGTARMLREALDLGYRNIMVLEDDIRFLKDTLEIERSLDAMPEDYDIVQFDKFVDWDLKNEDYRKMVEGNAISGSDGYFDGGSRFMPSGACFALNRHGMRSICDSLEKNGPRPVDGLFGSVGVRRAVIDRNMAVQVVFGNALLFQYIRKGNTHHRAYAPQGVKYEEYAVPNGYGYDKEFADYI